MMGPYLDTIPGAIVFVLGALIMQLGHLVSDCGAAVLRAACRLDAALYARRRRAEKTVRHG